MSNHYFTALRGQEAFNRFFEINKNDANSYQAGYEYYMDAIPRINEQDPEEIVNGKLNATAEIIQQLSADLLLQSWLTQGWPDKGTMLTRVVLAIDADTNAMLVLVRWNPIETPVHGHAYGQMLDYLMVGSAEETEYNIIDPLNRIVVPNGKHEKFFGPAILSNGYYKPVVNAERGALIHKFITKTNAITLHLLPEMPRDAKGNLFTEAETLQQH